MEIDSRPLLVFIVALFFEFPAFSATTDKFLIKSYDGTYCIHVDGKSVTAQGCAWKPPKAVKKPDRLTKQIFSIHQDEEEDQPSSSEEEIGSESSLSSERYKSETFIIRVKETKCISAPTEYITTGRCSLKRSRFFIRDLTAEHSSNAFTLESPVGQCISWDRKEPRLLRKPCDHPKFKNHTRTLAGHRPNNLHQLWVFCTEEENCKVAPWESYLEQETTTVESQPVHQTSITSTMTSKTTVVSTTVGSTAVATSKKPSIATTSATKTTNADSTNITSTESTIQISPTRVNESSTTTSTGTQIITKNTLKIQWHITLFFAIYICIANGLI